jgi:hypothetical protein
VLRKGPAGWNSTAHRIGLVTNHQRRHLHVWYLVARALKATGFLDYTPTRTRPSPEFDAPEDPPSDFVDDEG